MKNQKAKANRRESKTSKAISTVISSIKDAVAAVESTMDFTATPTSEVITASETEIVDSQFGMEEEKVADVSEGVKIEDDLVLTSSADNEFDGVKIEDDLGIPAVASTKVVVAPAGVIYSSTSMMPLSAKLEQIAIQELKDRRVLSLGEEVEEKLAYVFSTKVYGEVIILEEDLDAVTADLSKACLSSARTVYYAYTHKDAVKPSWLTKFEKTIK